MESGVVTIIILSESFIQKLQFLSYSGLLFRSAVYFFFFFLPLLFLYHCSSITLHQAQDGIAVGVECKTVIKRKLRKKILGKKGLSTLKTLSIKIKFVF